MSKKTASKKRFTSKKENPLKAVAGGDLTDAPNDPKYSGAASGETAEDFIKHQPKLPGTDRC